MELAAKIILIMYTVSFNPIFYVLYLIINIIFGKQKQVKEIILTLLFFNKHTTQFFHEHRPMLLRQPLILALSLIQFLETKNCKKNLFIKKKQLFINTPCLVIFKYNKKNTVGREIQTNGLCKISNKTLYGLCVRTKSPIR